MNHSSREGPITQLIFGIDRSSPDGECQGNSVNAYPPAQILRRLGTATLIVSSLFIHTLKSRTHVTRSVQWLVKNR
jgi:hypothetical protein